MPDITIFQNAVPKQFIFSDNYMQLVPGGGEVFEMIPRMWAFEVSTVIIDEKTIGGKKVPIKKDILLYSKLMCRTWPHCSSLAKRIARMYDEYEQADGDSIPVLESFKFTGKVKRQGTRSGASSIFDATSRGSLISRGTLGSRQ